MLRFPSRALAALLCVCVPAALLAAGPPVERAQRAYDELRFADVLREVRAARRAGGCARDELVELARLEAFTWAVYDDGGRAVAAFRRLLALEPDFALGPEVSPKIRRYLDTARAARVPAPRPTAPMAPAPRAPPRPAPRARPVYASGWFWAAVAGALGVGAGVGWWLHGGD